MDRFSSSLHGGSIRRAVSLAFIAVNCSLRAETTSTNPDFAALGESALRLLVSGEVDRFANEVAASIEDWRGVSSANAVAKATGDDPPGPEFEKGPASTRRAVSDSARLVRDQATRLGLEPSRVRFRVKDVSGKATSTFHDPRVQAERETLSCSFDIKIILLAEPVGDADADQQFHGEYELAFGGTLRFPAGWRTYEGIRWSRFPPGVADEHTQGELVLISKVATPTQSLHAKDDPALATLGNTLIRFLRQRDEKIFETEARRSFDETWREFEKRFAKDFGDRERPPARKEVEESWEAFRDQIMGSARGVLAQGESLGFDFSGAEIILKDAMADQPCQRGGYGSVDGLSANRLLFTVGVRSEGRSKAGRPISGEYTIVAAQAQRSRDRWTVEDKIR